MSNATVMQNTQFRKELLDRLLCKKVTYQDVLRHGLSQQEIEYLHKNDILTRHEYIRLFRKAGYSKSGAYKKRLETFKRISKDFNPELFIATIRFFKKNNEIDTARRMSVWLDIRLAGGIPAIEIFGVKDYVVDLLGRVRDELYERKAFYTDEAARELGVSSRHIRRLAKEGLLQKENRGLISEDQVADYLRQQTVREFDSCISAVKKLSRNKVGFNGELQKMYEELRVCVSESTVDQKRT